MEIKLPSGRELIFRGFPIKPTIAYFITKEVARMALNLNGESWESIIQDLEDIKVLIAEAILLSKDAMVIEKQGLLGSA